MGIQHDPRRRTWHLSTARSSYLIAEGSGRLRNLHWGGPLTDADTAALAELPPGVAGPSASFDVSGSDEITPYGGRELRTPSIMAEFADGTRTLDLTVTDSSYDGNRLDITLTDAAYPLSVQLHYLVRDDVDVIERRATITNSGTAGPVQLHSAQTADIRLPAGATRLSYLHGGWGAEPQLDRVPLPEGRIEVDSRGLTNHRARPWFAVDDGDAGETHGEVWSASLAWTGPFRIAVERSAEGRLHAVAGMHPLDFRYALQPGESLELPLVALHYSADGFGATSRGWHDYQRSYVLRTTGPRPVLYNSWEATYFDVTLAGQSALAERAARIGCELFVVDDGWFLGRRDDHAGLGDWTPDLEKLPGGLDPLISRVHELGMKFGLWVEPEMVNPDSDLYREHPDWVYHFANRPRTEARNQLMLNLARNDVREFVWSTLDSLLREHDIGFIKWDFNRPVTEPGWPEAPYDNAERLWVDHVRNLYGILDRLRADHPTVAFEACSGGGGRIDLGIIGRTDQVWISDNTDPFDRIALQNGYSQAYPVQTMVSWVAASPSHFNSRPASLAYRFHVSMSGVLGIGDDLTSWTEDELTEAAALVAAYKEWRDVVCDGDLYRLATTPVEALLAAVEYVAKDRRRAVLFAFGHGRSYRRSTVRVRLSGLDPERSYRVEGRPGVTEPVVWSGRLLAASGMDLALRGDVASAMVTLTAV
ncbi:MAG TPA: alpha-galactosidase [Mycobacteriales bacterium]|nr:alpha-galactosidase [Mycobacteriales bacterium]